MADVAKAGDFRRENEKRHAVRVMLPSGLAVLLAVPLDGLRLLREGVLILDKLRIATEHEVLSQLLQESDAFVNRLLERAFVQPRFSAGGPTAEAIGLCDLLWEDFRFILCWLHENILAEAPRVDDLGECQGVKSESTMIQ